MKVKRSKKGLAALLALCMALFAVPFTAQAAENSVTLDISKGNITITSTGYTAEGATSETSFTGDYHIMQSNNETATENIIKVDSGSHKITIDGLNIAVTSFTSYGLIDLNTKTTGIQVDLFLTGANQLKKTGTSGTAAIAVTEGNTLTINGNGSLTITAGSTVANIGSLMRPTELKKCGTVIINSGTLNLLNESMYAINGYGAAGIGGSHYGSTSASDSDGNDGGDVTINGGTITIKSGPTGAGIGGGFGGRAGTTKINGGSVNIRLTGSSKKVRIGTGCSGTDIEPGRATSVPPTDTNGNTLYLTTLTLENAANAAVTSVEGLPSGYGLTNVATDSDGKLYFYVPQNTTITSVTMSDGKVYEGTVTTSADDNAAATFSASGPAAEDRSATITAKATIPSPTYTVTIPATVDVGELVQKASNASDKIKSTPLTVSASGVNNLFGQKKVNVAVSTADGNFKLADGSNKLDYSVFSAATGGSALTSGATFAEFTAAGDNTGRIEIDQSAIDRAGNYTGTLTFTISLSDISA